MNELSKYEWTFFILTNKGYYFWLIASIIFFIASTIIISNNVGILLSVIVIFVIFDLIGYEAVKETEKYLMVNELDNIGYFRPRQSFRILQVIVEVLIDLILLKFCGWRYTLVFEIIHFTSGLDILYNIFGNYPIIKDSEGMPIIYSYKKWTVLGWFKKEFNGYWDIGQALIGILVSYFIISNNIL